MKNQTIETLNKEFELANENAGVIEIELQNAWNEVFKELPVIKDMVTKLESSNDFIFDKYGEIASYISFDSSDFLECRGYFETYMQDYHYINVDWDGECLLYNQGPDSITIQDDTRYDNGVWFNHKVVINESEYKDDDGVNETKRNALIEAYMERTGYFPGVFRVDSHGNVFLVNTNA